MPAGVEQMAARRQVLIDAAEQLIRKTGATDFTMAALAEMAGVSPATPYNLFATKSALFYALLNRSMDGVDEVGILAGTESDPFIRAMRSAEGVARFFTADSVFYRALYRVLLGVADPIHRPAFMERAINYWKHSARGLEERRLLSPEFPLDQLAQEMLSSFVGTMDLWVHGELSDDVFAARCAYSSLALTLGMAQGKARAQVLRAMRGCRVRLPEEFSFRPAGGGKRAWAQGPARGSEATRTSVRRARRGMAAI